MPTLQWRKLVQLLIISCGLPLLQARADLQPVPKIRMGTPPNQIIQEILDASAGDHSRAAMAKGPLITWLADCDSRLTTGLIASIPTDIYQIRNLGGILATAWAETDTGVLIHYTPVLLITGHTGSEAVAMSLHRPQGLSAEQQKALEAVAAVAAALPPEERQPVKIAAALVERQVRQACTRYRERITSGRLAVVGAIIDIDDIFGAGQGRLYLVSINGETAPAKMQAMPAASALGLRHIPFLGLPPTPPMTTDGENENPGGKPGSHKNRGADTPPGR